MSTIPPNGGKPFQPLFNSPVNNKEANVEASKSSLQSGVDKARECKKSMLMGTANHSFKASKELTGTTIPQKTFSQTLLKISSTEATYVANKKLMLTQLTQLFPHSFKASKELAGPTIPQKTFSQTLLKISSTEAAYVANKSLLQGTVLEEAKPLFNRASPGNTAPLDHLLKSDSRTGA